MHENVHSLKEILWQTQTVNSMLDISSRSGLHKGRMGGGSTYKQTTVAALLERAQTSSEVWRGARPLRESRETSKRQTLGWHY